MHMITLTRIDLWLEIEEQVLVQIVRDAIPELLHRVQVYWSDLQQKHILFVLVLGFAAA